MNTMSAITILRRSQSRNGRQGTQRFLHRHGVKVLSRTCPSPLLQRHMSDNLLGHSPMAQPVPNQGVASEKKKIPTAEDLTTVGGVWAPTSAKRVKLKELKGELKDGQTELDDAATAQEMLDLNLADGLMCIMKSADQASVDSHSKSNHEVLFQFSEWMDSRSKEFARDLTSTEWNIFLAAVSQKVELMLEEMETSSALQDVRDFMEPYADRGTSGSEQTTDFESVSAPVNKAFDEVVNRYRLELVHAASAHMGKSWDRLTSVSDSDLDRAAISETPLKKKASTLPLSSAVELLNSYCLETCFSQVDAWWKLMDRDNDGLLDQAEMDAVCYMSIQPVFVASSTLLKAAVDAHPVRTPLPSLTEEDDDSSAANQPKKTGWRERQQERRVCNKLLRLYRGTVRNHFVDEVEMAHRLRCIYAWAEKEHQDNKIDSVLVDEGGFAGRKRYVELEPKISLKEFREVQQEHFTHLDRVGQELVKSFREDLLVDQGQGRERQELYQQGTAFLLGTALVDAVIGLA